MSSVKQLHYFFESDKAGGLLLVFVTVLSLILANSPVHAGYIGFWQSGIAGQSITHWINDGLMSIFFLYIGLELEREIYQGELSRIKNASLPILAALGGMLVPAGLFFIINAGANTQSGAGIPMATDIAFAIGILSLLGNRVPASLRIFLTALAVIDDLGAIVVIAVFYTASLAFAYLLAALAVFACLLALKRFKVRNLIPYLIGGIIMWYCMLHSGVHATIAGVLLAFAIPFKNGGQVSLSYKLQHFLHKPVTFFILPLFAMANTCVALKGNWAGGLLQAGSLGIMAGLIVGKPLGIWLFSFTGARLGLCELPASLKWKNIIGAGFLGGIGFTMSIFITLLAFNAGDTINNSKIAILVASFVAGTIGFVWLRRSL